MWMHLGMVECLSLKAWVRSPRVDLGVGPRTKLNFFGMQQHGSKCFAHRHILDPRGGVKRSNHIFDSSHVAYQIKGN